jgi:hypothetical protein
MSFSYKKFIVVGLVMFGLNFILNAQSLRNDMISAMGGNYQSADLGFTIHQSIGQSTVIGMFSNSSLSLSQGYLRGMQVLNKEVMAPFEVIPFPNAFADRITFRFVTDNAEETLFTIYDMNGRKVFDETLLPVGNEVLLDLDFLANGLYLAILRSGNRIVQKRIIKNK